MKISIFENAWDNEPKPYECTWESFTQELGPHDYTYTEKKACPLFSPAEYPDGVKRLAKNVQRLWLYVADLDHLTQEQVLSTLTRVHEHALAAVVYSSWSHASDPWRIRIAHPLTRPVLPAEWPAFWTTMTQAYGGVVDEQCSDVSHMYFGPYAPAGTEAVNFYQVFPGVAIDVNAVLKRAGSVVQRAEDGARADAIRILGEAWPSERRREAHLALAGGLLMSGISDDEAIDILCRVAVIQDPDNEDRKKRERMVSNTRRHIDTGERTVGWTTLAGIIGGEVVAQAKAVLQAPPKITRNQLELFAKNLKQKKNDAIVELGEALLQVCKGESFAEPSNRHEIVFRLASQLAERFTDFDAKSIADLFIPSLQLIGLTTATCPSLDDITAAILKRQRELRAKQFAEQQAERDEVSTRIREAFKNGREYPYTKEELKGFGLNISKRWLIQRDKAFYLFFNGSYKGPFSDKEVVNTAVRELAPARSAGVYLRSVSDAGKVGFKDIKTLVDEYGTVAESMVVDLSAQKTTYNEQERCVIEAPCLLRPIKPVFHAEVDQWLRILCWNDPHYYENLKSWLAVLTRLDFICSALFLTGKKSVGKSMFAQGISRIWTINGPTKLEDAFGSFNDQLASCPFTFADEYLPKDFRGYTKFEELRAHVQETERPYRRKFLPTSKMLGATRTMIAAHNKTILKTPQTLTDDDISAIIERFFYIPTNPEAAVFLANLRPTTFERGWVSRDVIAEHILWLRDNHPHQSQGRFYVHVPDETLFRTLSTQSGSKGTVCQWLVSYLLKSEEFHKSAYSNLYVRIKHGKFLVNPRGISDTWSTYIGQNERCPQFGTLARVVSELSTGERLKYQDKKGVWTNYRVIEMKNLVSWVEDNDFCDPEILLEMLKHDTNEN